MPKAYQGESVRYLVSSSRHAKNLSKSIKRAAEAHGVSMQLSAAQRALANIYGYRDWHDLEKSIDPLCVPGPVDGELSHAQAQARTEHSLSVLVGVGLSKDVAKAVLAQTNPTGSAFNLQQLTWTLIDTNEWEGRGDKDFVVRIFPGRVSRSAGIEAFGVTVFDTTTPWSLFKERLEGAGYTATRFDVEFPEDGHRLEDGDSIDEVKEKVDRLWRDLRIQEAQVRRLGRTVEAVDDPEFLVGVKNLPVELVTTIAPGFLKLYNGDREYLSLDAKWLKKLPSFLRPPVIEEGDRHEYLVWDRGAAIVLSFPKLFTDSEVAQAHKDLERDYSETHEALTLGEKATPAQRAKGGEGFSTPKIYLQILAEEGDTVLAVADTVFGILTDQRRHDLFQQIHMFRFEADEWPGELDLHSDRYLGLHPLTRSEYLEREKREDRQH